MIVSKGKHTGHNGYMSVCINKMLGTCILGACLYYNELGF